MRHGTAALHFLLDEIRESVRRTGEQSVLETVESSHACGKKLFPAGCDCLTYITDKNVTFTDFSVRAPAAMNNGDRHW